MTQFQSFDFSSTVSLDLDGNDRQEPLYHYRMTVHDNGVEVQLSVDIDVYVRVVRVNEYSPQFTPNAVTLFLKENVLSGSVITTLNATDGDSGSDGNVTYLITSGNKKGVFGMDAENLVLRNRLDHETDPAHSLLITATDNPVTGASRSSTLAVTVRVIDVNDNRPMFSKAFYDFNVPDNAVIGDVVAAVTATDRDSGLNGQLEYTVTSGSTPLFKLDNATGSFIPLASLDLDAQSLTSKSFEMVVFVTDKGEPSRLNNTVNATLRIVAVNEYAPSLSHSADVTMLLRSAARIGSTVFKINATDADFGLDGKITYGISSGNEDSVFSLDSTTGNGLAT